ncbi:hypothetical protein O181_046593 [Austropuccinia psidii MF-1]|uniref:Peptidyl-prolyl cis-trans isomerase n=1 Tax=Austropuccinia psidii MF-1 TaxID=1389203 RepID=A0A9Q3DUE5_9BASI|nr:hypothetical protein [Austropuccinia psidii MF-1]
MIPNGPGAPATATDWEIRFSQSRQRPYFYSEQLKVSSWEPPADLTAEQIMKLSGAHFLHGAVASQGPGAALIDEGRVRASHILIKHCQSRRPSSFRQAHITRTKEEAIEILKGLQSELKLIEDAKDLAKLKEKFSTLAEEYSDCSSYIHGGDLCYFSKGQMQKKFQDAAFGLEVNGISGIIETDSGVHLIFRTE